MKTLGTIGLEKLADELSGEAKEKIIYVRVGGPTLKSRCSAAQTLLQS